ncbi:aminotransferase class I/II-fold pyridoxal phosphate-dependent enzyme [Chondromyces apiculatus]|uniref:8-amino-7-oxononanoate synthase n=1 Tax=Chondromyces apiculatus DSM 436 TaxID=1192034 RepID=A0A017T4X1_9BACT|nr:8-amino-7-oxononanoate synthase [Chondromyces apiculatus]EYF03591.1 8-amino-7-oxononanoate synthase [Chondromyces apiculatus DSM 436]
MALDPLRHLVEEIAALEAQGLLRDPAVALPPPEALVLCSNDYLGYASLPGPALTAGGAGASRLVSGNHPAHLAAEEAIARWLGAEAALLFSSGYAANVGTLAALAGPGDVIFSDALNHASLIDGCRLSRASLVIVPHLDTVALEHALGEARTYRRRWVVTEAVFSMDGDRPDLPRLRALCDAQDAALVVDEAHALGVLGPQGAGLCAQLGVRADVRIGTLGKSLGLHGAFVVGSTALRTWLWNRARSFVFSTGISPALAVAATERVGRASRDEAGRQRLLASFERLRAGLLALGARIPPTAQAPVLPWILDTPSAAVSLSRRLAAQGVMVQAIRPPTVPAGTSRLRITATATLSAADVERALVAFREALG